MGWFWAISGLFLLTGVGAFLSIPNKERKELTQILETLGAVDERRVSDTLLAEAFPVEASRSEQEISEVLNSVVVPYSLRNKYALLLSKLEASSGWKGLSVEEEHDLSVMLNQLVDTIRLYEALPDIKKASKVVKEELKVQFDLFLETAARLETQTVDSNMKNLKINTEFALQKFRRVNLLKMRR